MDSDPKAFVFMAWHWMKEMLKNFTVKWFTLISVS